MYEVNENGRMSYVSNDIQPRGLLYNVECDMILIDIAKFLILT